MAIGPWPWRIGQLSLRIPWIRADRASVEQYGHEQCLIWTTRLKRQSPRLAATHSEHWLLNLVMCMEPMEPWGGGDYMSIPL